MKLQYKKFESKRRFGVEFEMSNDLTRKRISHAISSMSDRSVKVSRYALSSKNNYWHVKSDSSCGPRGVDGPCGIEVATYICSGSCDAHHVSRTMGAVKKLGATVNEHCGLHVHVDVSDFSEDDIGRMLLFWVAIERVLTCAMPPTRHNNKYCKTLTSVYDEFFLEWLYRLHGAGSIAKIFKPCNDLFMDNAAKRRTINVVNFYKVLDRDSEPRKTVEFRWAEGSLRPLDIRCWVFLFVSFIDNVKSNLICPLQYLGKSGGVRVSDVLEVLGLGTLSEDAFSILDHDLFATRKWLLKRVVSTPSTISLHKVPHGDAMTGFQEGVKMEAQTLLDLMNKHDGGSDE